MVKATLRSVGVIVLALALLATGPASATAADAPEAPRVGDGYVALRGEQGVGPTTDDPDDEDGIRPTRRSVRLDALAVGRSVPDDHDHDRSTPAGVVVDVPEQPEMLIIDEVTAGSELAVRTRSDGAWSDWTEVVATEDEAPDADTPGEGERHDGVASIGPIWLGHGVERIEIVSHSRDDRFDIETLEVLDVPSAAVSEGPRNFAGTAAAAGTPFIRPRSHWATSEMTWKCSSGPTEASVGVEGMIVHHTAGGNSYGPADVPAVIRGIWYYHVGHNGWCDVAYNFFVDRFGQIWEGRQGGIKKAIIGGHTYAFNTGTSGVAQLGDFHNGAPPWAMTLATGRLVGWKLAIHGVDPSGKTTYKNRSSVTAKDGTPPGGTKTLSSVVGHRDLGSTSCPGQHTYAQLPRIRRDGRIGAHIRALFRAFIGTTPSRESYEDWSAYAVANGLLAAADQLSKTREYAGVVIRDAYKTVLGREPDSSGMAYWLDQLRSGLTVSRMLVYFYGGSEYYKGTGGRGAYVDALYAALLHRKPDSSGRAYWIGELDRGVAPAVIAASFIDSIESRYDRVARLYQRFLKRDPDKSGHEYWAEVLLHSDDLALATHLALSSEFYHRHYS